MCLRSKGGRHGGRVLCTLCQSTLTVSQRGLLSAPSLLLSPSSLPHSPSRTRALPVPSAALGATLTGHARLWVWLGRVPDRRCAVPHPPPTPRKRLTGSTRTRPSRPSRKAASSSCSPGTRRERWRTRPPRPGSACTSPGSAPPPERAGRRPRSTRPPPRPRYTACARGNS